MGQQARWVYRLRYKDKEARVWLSSTGEIVAVDGIQRLWIGESFGRLISWLRRSYGEVEYCEEQEENQKAGRREDGDS